MGNEPEFPPKDGAYQIRITEELREVLYLDEAKLVVVDLEAEGPLAAPVTLSAIKADPVFKEFPLVRMGRLSVMPVPVDLWKRLLSMGAGK